MVHGPVPVLNRSAAQWLRTTELKHRQLLVLMVVLSVPVVRLLLLKLISWCGRVRQTLGVTGWGSGEERPLKWVSFSGSHLGNVPL